MIRKIAFLIAALSIVALVSGREAFAAPRPIQISKEIIKEAPPPKAGMTWFEEYQKEKQELKDQCGTSYAVLANYQQEVLLNSYHYQGHSLGAWYYNVDFQQDLWKGAWMVAELEGGAGKGIDKYVPTFSVFDSSAGEKSLAYMPIFMLGQNFLDDRIYFAGGKLDLSDWFDMNDVANSGDMQFMSSSLVNNLTIPFPQKGLGFVAGAWLTDWMYAQYGISNAAAKAETIGLSKGLTESFSMAEAGFTPTICGRKGTYRFMFRFNRQRLDFVDGTGEQYGDTGFALSCDQKVTDRCTVFGRYGFADPKVRKIWNFWSCGVRLDKPFSFRKNDVLAFAVAQSLMGDEYRHTADPKSAAAETMFEAYYSIDLGGYLFVTPDIKVVLDPYADRKAPANVVFGVRAVALF